MKKILTSLLLTFLIQITGYSQIEIGNDSIYSTLKGPYLGQKLPSERAELFAPGIISTDEKEALYGVFNNGSYIVFDRTPKGFADWENYPIYICQEENGHWTKPVITRHLGEPGYLNYPDPIDSGELFYGWWLPLDENGAFTNLDLWKVKYDDGRWGEAEKLPHPINTKYVDMWPSITSNKVLYFFSNREGGAGGADIYRSVLENGKYTSAENLGPKINTPGLDHDPCISADGSFLIFSSNRTGSLGKDDLYVTFQQQSEEWTDPINLGEEVNSHASDNRPYLTPDGKYLFFTSMRNGNLDIFWVDVKLIGKLKPD
ncbi:MAG: hypothetical protein ABJG78_13060 [Cyclobacteriaceae bacterium]